MKLLLLTGIQQRRTVGYPLPASLLNQASGFSPASQRLGMKPLNLCQKRREGHWLVCYFRRHKVMAREKKEATPEITTIFCKRMQICYRMKNNTRIGHLLKFQTFTHAGCDNLRHFVGKDILKLPANSWQAIHKLGYQTYCTYYFQTTGSSCFHFSRLS